MKPESSLPLSSAPATRPYPEQVWGTVKLPKLCKFLWWVVAFSPNTRAIGPPLVGRPRLFIQYIRSYSQYLEAVLHPQTEDAPYCDDREPLITEPPQVIQIHTSCEVQPIGSTVIIRLLYKPKTHDRVHNSVTSTSILTYSPYPHMFFLRDPF